MTLTCRAVLASALIGLTATATYAQLSGGQQKCLNGLNKGAGKLFATQGKENRRCIKSAGKAQLIAPQTADTCLRADGKGKIAGAAAKLSDGYAADCVGDPPPVGLPAGVVPDVVRGVVIGQSTDLLADIFGGSLTNAVVACQADKDGCKCQQAISKTYEKLAAKAMQEFAKCKKSILKDGATSAAALEDCVDDAGTPGSIAADSKGKLAAARLKIGDAIAKKCTGLSSALLLPGLCAGLSGDALRDCVADRVDCRVCLTINGIDGLAVDCDAFDDGQLNLSCPYDTFNLRSATAPLHTPGSPGVTVTDPKMIAQFGGTDVNLNNARYTRFRLGPTVTEPDAILILIPGFEGGANDFKLLAENLIERMDGDGFTLEVWAYDRRSNQLEDMAGLQIAEALNDPLVALDWLFGAELGLTLHPALVAGPNRRASFYTPQSETAFIAEWSPLVFSRDIDAIVEKARTVQADGHVFLGGHSAGTGFAARYAATDFDFTGSGPAQPGYAKLRGLVLLEGAGGSTGGAPLTADTLDRIEAKFDGGLYGAVRDNAGRCVDGTTACTVANEAITCAGQTPPKCTPPTTAYAGGLLNPRLLAASEVTAIQAVTDPDSGLNILAADQGAPGNTAIAKVPDLGTLNIFPPSSAFGGIGQFVDDDGLVAGLAAFVAVSVGTTGAVIGGVTTWQDITEGPMPPGAVPNNGPAPTTLPGGIWGQEKEVTRIDRFTTTFFAGHSNFTDWYYPSSGLSVTSVTGVCTAGTCTAGNVGAACSNANQCSQSINLDSTALSVGRGRRDIENLTQAGAIDIPVIGFGGSNGLVPVPGRFIPFAQSIAPCSAPSCDGTPRVVDATLPNPAFPTFGGPDGGFEVHITEGVAHVDVLTAEDDADNNVLAPLAAFIARNAP